MNTTVTATIAGASVAITVTNLASTVNSFLSSLSSAKLVVGFDCEWNSSDANARVATLQLCNGNKCVVIQLTHLYNVPNSLKEFLINPSITFVGVGIGSDVEKLKKDYGLECNKCVELGPLAAQVYGKPALTAASLAELARVVNGIGIEKSAAVVRSNWAVRELSMDQVVYAATDAYAGYLVGSKLGV